MLQRFAIHLALVFLFAFAQVGVATHEISHFSDIAKHSQQDQKSQDKQIPAEQCEQCISYAKIASGLQLSAFIIPVITAGFTVTPGHYLGFQSHYSTAYSARAPPSITSI